MQATSDTPQAMNRRTFLKTSSALAATGAVVAAGSGRAAAGSPGDAFAAWFENVPNYDGVTDATGSTDVTVSVGSGSGFTFGPAAVRVDPGTTVTWRWTGKGGTHNVVASDGAFESAYASESGETFTHTFDDAGVSYYACAPHEAMGMKGAIVVGDILVGGSTAAGPTPDFDGWFDRVPGFPGTIDKRGEGTVTVTVSDDGFSPAAVSVDPGTTVVWQWADGSAAHAVVAADGSYESEVQTTGAFALTLDGDGISKYASTPEDGPTMHGAVVVGDGGVTRTTLSGTGVAAVSGTLTGLLALAGLLGYWERDRFTNRRGKPPVESPPGDAPSARDGTVGRSGGHA